MTTSRKKAPYCRQKVQKEDKTVDQELAHLIREYSEKYNQNNDNDPSISFERFISYLAYRIRNASYVDRIMDESSNKILARKTKEEKELIDSIKTLFGREGINSKRKGQGRKPELRLMSISMTAMGVYWFATGKKPTFTVRCNRAYGECLDFLSRVFDILPIDLKGENSQMQPSAESQVRCLKETMKNLDAALHATLQEAGRPPRPLGPLDLIDGPFSYGLR